MPVEIRIDDDRLRHEGRAVALVEGQVVFLGADRVAEYRGVPCQLAGMGAGIRVEQQLVGVEAVARLGLIGAVHAEAVERPRPDIGDMAVEDLVGVFGELEAIASPAGRRVENANLDLRRVG